ncbi:MAG TPA: twin-arginine translocation signal domain-containing protein [Bryobacteraceae bacterium]|nr:twin-arginine translocation signal domain-containing protein [Bryobacteraceae bacterium]
MQRRNFIKGAGASLGALTFGNSLAQPNPAKPANAIRAVSRLFCSDIEDKPWFNDRAMWPEYFSMLAANRFNRFHLAFGIGYDFLREVTDAYFLFFYPFVVSVSGYNVRATGVPEAERDRNLETLQYISDQAAAHGLEFQLGIWMHGYQWINSPNPHHVIEGLTAETHAPYCRDALAAVLRACPKITGVTFRVHGESGVPEGSYSFWKTVFEGVTRAGRRIEIDMHPKGVDQQMIDVGLATGMPLKLSPKFWAEHMGMPYHQADIRDQEIPHGRTATGLMALSSGSRSFTRYGYADLLREDRKYGIIHRIWPGTHRMLLWADPVTAAAYSRALSFCGSEGVDLMEPLSFKGRRGSGLPGGRCGYADKSLNPRWDWQKFLPTYQVWGRMMYDPNDIEGAVRGMDRSAIAALGSASRILPIITTAHLPSAANNTFWPEMYTNQPIVDAARKNPYTDTPSPKVFGNTSPLDPQLFSSVNAFGDELLSGERSGKYSPVEVAQWLEDLAAAATGQRYSGDRRLANDVMLQAMVGQFFGAKLRAGVLYRIHERTGDRTALEEALKAYRRAREIWAGGAQAAKPVYVADLTVGEHPWLRGNWADRLEAIDGDIADMSARLAGSKGVPSGPGVTEAIAAATGKPQRPTGGCRHTPPANFRPSQAVDLSLESNASSVRLWYRHVTQAERWQSLEMLPMGTAYRAAIPATYTDSPYPLQYYFELRTAADKVWLHPGFGPDLTNQPYFVLRKGAS